MTNLSEYLEQGIATMEARGMRQSRALVFAKFHPDLTSGKPRACCVLGAILLGMGVEPASSIMTEAAIDLIRQRCPVIDAPVLSPHPAEAGLHVRLAVVLWRLSDGADRHSQMPLNEIAVWLRERGY